MKWAICNELFDGWSFDRVCRYAASLGYQGVEIAPFTLATPITNLSARDRARLKDQADDAGVAIVGLHWLLARTDGLHLTSRDRDIQSRTADYLVALGECCRDLGGRVMVFGSPRQRSRLPGVSAREAFDLAVALFQRVMPSIAACGVTICFEPLAPVETDVVTTVADAVRLIEAVNHPHFGLQLDVKAMSAESIPVPDLVRRYAARAQHVHVNDANGRGPGFGETQFEPILTAFDASGYNGWLSLEVFDFSPDPETIARRSLEYLTACLAKE
jgi:sugar phosphate isomerase/epimerase